MNDIILNSLIDIFSATFNLDKSRFCILPASFTTGFPRTTYEQAMLWFDQRPLLLYNNLNSYLLFHNGTMLELADPDMLSKLLTHVKDIV